MNSLRWNEKVWKCLQLSARRRSYHYTRNGELISKPRVINVKNLFHPVLGHYSSEFLLQPINAADPHSSINTSIGENFMEALKKHHQQQFFKERQKFLDSESSDLLTLGQVVAVKRYLNHTQNQSSTFFGVVVEVKNSGLSSSFRLRNVVMSVGVELHVPIYSRKIQWIKILKRPASVPLGPNLLGLRNDSESMSKYIHPSAFTDKGRQALLYAVERNDWSDVLV